MLNIYKTSDRRKAAVLDNALNIVEDMRINEVYTLAFDMPVDDQKNNSAKPLKYVRFTGDTESELYRILGSKKTEAFTGDDLYTYNCEHVIATLIDELIFGTLEIVNHTTREVIEQVLNQQKTRRWVLGECDFTRYFSYSWTDESVLGALHSVANRLDEPYMWTYDTSAFPWVVSLKRVDTSARPQFYIHDSKNLIRADSESNMNQFCNRIYAHGQGDGINKMGIEDVNEGVPYVENPASIMEYGLVERVFADERFTVKESLKERALALLEGLSVPYEAYNVSVADLYKITGQASDRPELGKIVKWRDLKRHIVALTRYHDADGQDALEIANKPLDLASSISDLAERQRINAIYAQGATNIYAFQGADNCTPNRPLRILFDVPHEAVNINKVRISWNFEPFRAYSQTTSSGGGSSQTSSSGGGSQQSSSSGGGGSTTSQSGGGSVQSTSTDSEKSRTSSSGGSSSPTSSSAGGYQGTTGVNANYTSGQQSGSGTTHVHNIGPHSHSIGLSAHTHNVSISSHTHNVTVPAHNHTVNVPAHTHTVDMQAHTHNVNIPAHSHNVDIPAHTHNIEPGIYEGRSASALTRIELNGQSIPVPEGARVLDIAEALAQNDDGKINRGQINELLLYPDQLSRISYSFFSQMFIRSEGGGLY